MRGPAGKHHLTKNINMHPETTAAVTTCMHDTEHGECRGWLDAQKKDLVRKRLTFAHNCISAHKRVPNKKQFPLLPFSHMLRSFQPLTFGKKLRAWPLREGQFVLKHEQKFLQLSKLRGSK